MISFATIRHAVLQDHLARIRALSERLLVTPNGAGRDSLRQRLVPEIQFAQHLRTAVGPRGQSAPFAGGDGTGGARLDCERGAAARTSQAIGYQAGVLATDVR